MPISLFYARGEIDVPILSEFLFTRLKPVLQHFLKCHVVHTDVLIYGLESEGSRQTHGKEGGSCVRVHARV